MKDLEEDTQTWNLTSAFCHGSESSIHVSTMCILVSAMCISAPLWPPGGGLNFGGGVILGDIAMETTGMEPLWMTCWIQGLRIANHEPPRCRGDIRLPQTGVRGKTGVREASTPTCSSLVKQLWRSGWFKCFECIHLHTKREQDLKGEKTLPRKSRKSPNESPRYTIIISSFIT